MAKDYAQAIKEELKIVNKHMLKYSIQQVTKNYKPPCKKRTNFINEKAICSCVLK